jgi:hypothetical protein
MTKKLTNYGKAVLVIGGLTLLLLFVMNTELHLHPFSIHIHKPEKLMEVFIQVCAFLFFDYHGRWEGFKEGAMFTLDMIKKEQEKREKEEEQEDGKD